MLSLPVSVVEPIFMLVAANRMLRKEEPATGVRDDSSYTYTLIPLASAAASRVTTLGPTP